MASSSSSLSSSLSSSNNNNNDHHHHGMVLLVGGGADSNNNSNNHDNHTYEATKARVATWAQPDKIHWNRDTAYRKCPYRQLHHQQGLIGTLEVRLLEASSLKRSYWSALALGPVKHLGLSKAHGPISSFCILSLQQQQNHHDSSSLLSTKSSSSSVVATSSVVANNNDPVWTNAVFTLPLKKGTFTDGTPIQLSIQMMEDATAAEQMGLPGVPSPQDRLLGTGTLDVTCLLLGMDQQYGKSISGVLDVWIPIFRRQRNNNNNNTNNNNNNSNTANDDSCTGRVRLLVSYKPHGLTPQIHDLVALEAFARRSLTKSSCRPILANPLSAMRILDQRDTYYLCEYTLTTTTTTNINSNTNKNSNMMKSTMRLHRNAIFVIERTNLMDGAINVVCMPTDYFFSTSIGKTTQHVTRPLVQAGSELIQPALLAIRVLWAAVRTTGVASFVGVQAASHAIYTVSRDAHAHQAHQASLQTTPGRGRQQRRHQNEPDEEAEHGFV